MIIYRFLFYYAYSFYEHFDKNTGEAMAIGVISMLQALIVMGVYFIMNSLNIDVPVVPKYIILIFVLILMITNALYLLYFVGKQKIIDTISQYSLKKKQMYALAVLVHVIVSIGLPTIAFYMR